MLVTLSPAKSLDETSITPIAAEGLPKFLNEAQRVRAVLAKKSIEELMDLQHISRNLAEQNFHRNQTWEVAAHSEVTKPAIALFKGDVYLGLQVEDWTAQEFQFAQQHLRILSGLYGILEPLNKILPYRLEMGTPLPIEKANNLVKFWQPIVTEALNAHPSKVWVDLASQEYSKSIVRSKINKRVITVDFKDYKNGQYKTLSFFAKRARGAMARWIVKNGVTNPELLVEFQGDGYTFYGGMSSADHLVFTKG